MRNFLLAAMLLSPITATAQQGNTAQLEKLPPRMFPQFAGTWILDEQASKGRIVIAPRIPKTLTITATPEALTLTEVLRLDQRDNASPDQVRVVRFDGTPTVRWPGSGVYEYHDSFQLAADMLVIATKTIRIPEGEKTFDVFTDALSVDGDVLTLHRQLVHVDAPGTIATMREPTNNFKHTFIYRRSR